MIRLPSLSAGPLRALSVRLAAALALVLFIVFVVYFDRAGYRDNNSDGLTLLDCFYYAVVTLSTTGYGDITPVSQPARLVNVIFVTPARVLFLIILVGTTLQVLTEQYRTAVRLTRWRKTLKDHVIICGYGTKGRSAVRAVLENGIDRKSIVVVEPNDIIARQATADGLAVIEGSATRSSVLTEAGVKDAKTVIVATDTDEASVLVCLTVRQLTAGKVRVVAAAREDENAPLLRQSGAHQVVVSSGTAGRLLGLSTSAPPLIDVVEDLLTPGAGMALAMRSATRAEVGSAPRSVGDLVIALYRRGRIVSLSESESATVKTGDMLVYVRDDRTAPPAPPTGPLP
jgi:voltage-gated potassium channel